MSVANAIGICIFNHIAIVQIKRKIKKSVIVFIDSKLIILYYYGVNTYCAIVLLIVQTEVV